jgi:DNA-binding NtrC family response regulator
MANDKPSVLIIDDDPEFAADLSAILTKDFHCRTAQSGEEGLGAISGSPPDVVVLDLMLGGRNGLEILREVRLRHPHLQVIMATDHPSAETEAAAIEAGALYYLRKSAGHAEISAKLRRCLDVGRTSWEREALQGEVHQHFLATSPMLRRLEERINRVAAAPTSTVLITGESGTGKSLIAREIHRRSPRSRGPFHRVNMAALTEELIKSELFGHRKGGFTGAIEDRRGHFVAAGGGSLFLDEIGDLSPSVQGMLNTAIEERRITPVGSSDELRIDVRVLAATSRDLNALVESGQFRRDLLGRLSVVPLHVPPLREHPEDIADLVRYFVGRLSAEMALPQVTVRPEAIARLQRYHWPYNVRELRNAVEQALIFFGQEGVLGEEAFGFLDVGARGPGSEGGIHGPDAHRGSTQVWGPFPWAGEGTLDYRTQRDAVVLGFKREIMERAFRMAGGSVDWPRANEIGRVAEIMGITTKGVRDVLRELEGPDRPTRSSGSSDPGSGPEEAARE